MISGEEKCSKPDPKLYKRFLQKFNLDPQDCLFIDDQQSNVTTALHCGIQSIVCPQNGGQTDFNEIQYQLA